MPAMLPPGVIPPPIPYQMLKAMVASGEIDAASLQPTSADAAAKVQAAIPPGTPSGGWVPMIVEPTPPGVPGYVPGYGSTAIAKRGSFLEEWAPWLLGAAALVAGIVVVKRLRKR